MPQRVIDETVFARARHSEQARPRQLEPARQEIMRDEIMRQGGKMQVEAVGAAAARGSCGNYKARPEARPDRATARRDESRDPGNIVRANGRENVPRRRRAFPAAACRQGGKGGLLRSKSPTRPRAARTRPARSARSDDAGSTCPRSWAHGAENKPAAPPRDDPDAEC